MTKGIKSLVNKKMTQNVKFIGEDIKISKLTVAEVMEIQNLAKTQDNEDSTGFELLKRVIKMSVEGGDELTDEDFNSFPMDELTKLSQAIMRFSGVAGDQGK
jgi:hypothetical protein